MASSGTAFSTMFVDIMHKLYTMIEDRLSKISGALRYKTGYPIEINGNFNNAGRFSVDMGSDIPLFTKATYYISLQNFSTTSNITNITTNNNKFWFSSPTTNTLVTPNIPANTITSVTLPTGVYGVDSLNSTVQSLMQSQGFYNTSYSPSNNPSLMNIVIISVNPSTQKSVLQIQYNSGYTICLNLPNNLGTTLGFLSTNTFTDPYYPVTVPTTAPINGNYYSAIFSSNVAQYTNNVLAIRIGCTLADGSYMASSNNQVNTQTFATQNQIIASKSYIDPPGSVLAIQPANPMKVRMAQGLNKIRTFDLFCIDNNNNPISFNNIQFYALLLIEQS